MVSTMARDDEPALGGYLALSLTERETAGWVLVIPGRAIDKAIADRTIAPLVRLGLLAPQSDDPGRLVVSGRGAETWDMFRQRGERYPEDLTDL